ncbi:MAG: polymer-forming cytoskeletal protein [Myxococcota bacterium]
MTDPAGYFAEDLIIRGRIEGEGAVEVAGTFDGPVALRGRLAVAPTGRVTGAVAADEVHVSGVLRGDVTAVEAHIGASGRVIGDVKASRIALDDGGVLDGTVLMDVALPEELSR